MERIVVAERTFGRVLALLPAIVVAVAVRVLTLGAPPVAVRVLAAAAVAGACWTAYRLLTARLVVTDGGIDVRGVLYDAHVPWSDLHGVDVRPAPAPLRALVWGLMQPHTLVLRTSGRTLLPLAAIGESDDDDLRRAIGAMRVRSGAWRVPEQRVATDHVNVG